MGEIAEMMLEGTLCESCGEYIGCGDAGFPMYCVDCGGDPEVLRAFQSADDPIAGHSVRKTPRDTLCPICKKKYRGEEGVRQHMHDKHGEEG